MTNSIRSTSTIRFITLTVAFTSGIVLACRAEPDPADSNHCFDNDGDRTCGDLYGDERPYCAGPGESCEVAPDPDGCVAELPSTECYSPCGGGVFAADDMSCSPSAEEGDGDGDEEAEGDGDGDAEGDGDGDDPPADCGNGVIDGDEECDDGNTIDIDACSNACTMAVCGDGLIQIHLGETCDDGNTVGGDGCASSCVLPGTILWSKNLGIPNATGQSVAVTPSGDIGLIAYSSELGHRVIGLTANGDLMWNEEAPPQPTNIAAGPDGELVIGGVVDGKGKIWRFGFDDGLSWAATVSQAPISMVREVAIDGQGSIYSVGSASDTGMIWRHASSGAPHWLDAVMGTSSVNQIAAGVEGGAWVLRENPRQILHYNQSNELAWASEHPALELVADIYADLATDPAGNLYLAANLNGIEAFAVGKFSPDGETSWVTFHDDPGVLETAFAIAALPTGGAVTAGFTHYDGQSESNMLLTWYASDGTHMQDVVLDGFESVDADLLQGVAIDPDGNVVAVGTRHVEGSEYQLWVLKIAL
ncbi:MAG TPA: DUF4215 domain-containing protein [Enhygromyxa sp.]|nr:DUF4215 domain-containing protein [Enhygromyxa sp.]